MSGDIRVGQTVEITIEARVECEYQSGRYLIRWDSGEEIMLSSDVRLEDLG